MSYKAKVIEVMIASPSDVKTERDIARDVINEWNDIHARDKDLLLVPVGWRSHSTPEMGDRPQAIINKQVLKHCDLLIAIFWTRLGSPTGKFASGTVEEIEKHLDAGKPAMIYFSLERVSLDTVEDKQYKALLRFKETCRERGLIAEYSSLIDFKDQLHRHLAQTVLRRFSKKNGRANGDALVAPLEPRLPKLSNLARVLLREAAQDELGRIIRLRSSTGLCVKTHGVDFARSRDPQTEAKWDAALCQLRDAELVEERGINGEIFKLTHEGHRVARFLRPEPIAV